MTILRSQTLIMKRNQWCPIRYITIHSGTNLNKTSRNRKMENMEKSCK